MRPNSANSTGPMREGRGGGERKGDPGHEGMARTPRPDRQGPWSVAVINDRSKPLRPSRARPSEKNRLNRRLGLDARRLQVTQAQQHPHGRSGGERDGVRPGDRKNQTLRIHTDTTVGERAARTSSRCAPQVSVTFRYMSRP
jgi:hypothetical protein